MKLNVATDQLIKSVTEGYIPVPGALARDDADSLCSVKRAALAADAAAEQDV